MADPREGGCQCGKVRYRIEGAPVAVGVCHCSDCQRQSGSAFGMSLILAKQHFRLLSGELRSFTKTAESGRTVECLFCPDCGTRIYHVPTMFEGVVNVKSGTLGDTAWLEPSVHTWTQSRQPWVTIPEDVRSFDTQP